jgi:hypothetical protein
MATNKITLGPIPHFKEEWAAGITPKLDAIYTHKGSTYICTTAGTQTEPSFTYNSATGKYTTSAGWALVAVGAGAEVVEGFAQVSELKDGRLTLRVSNAVPPTQTKKESTKIGLRTCEKIMTALGGSFTVTNDGAHFAAEMVLPAE